MLDNKYYYSDALYQLELNLQNVRKELISMLEDFEQADCANCLQLKCKCLKDESKSGSERSLSSDWMLPGVEEERTSPPANTLPKPMWDQNDESPAPSTPEKETDNECIKAWIEASKKAEEYVKKISLLNSKKSLVVIESVRPANGSLNVPQRTTIIGDNGFAKNSYAFEEFVKYFQKTNETTITYVSDALAAACNKQINHNYTHF